MPEAPSLLLIANYGSELVAVAGALALNVARGGRTHAEILLSRPHTRPDLERAAAVIGCTIGFADLPYGDVNLSYEQKRRVVETVRSFRPDVVVMQDPEHAWNDLDPDRRMGMMLTLEALALAGRDFAQQDLPDLEPCPLPTVYYLWPENPNCIVNVASVWHIKEKADECISYQHDFTAYLLEQKLPREDIETAIPGYSQLENRAARGLAIHHARERSSAIYHGLGGHGDFALAEVYRCAEEFHLEYLKP